MRNHCKRIIPINSSSSLVIFFLLSLSFDFFHFFCSPRVHKLMDVSCCRFDCITSCGRFSFPFFFSNFKNVWDQNALNAHFCLDRLTTSWDYMLPTVQMHAHKQSIWANATAWKKIFHGVKSVLLNCRRSMSKDESDDDVVEIAAWRVAYNEITNTIRLNRKTLLYWNKHNVNGWH